ncbi:hypothetical protein JHK87_055238 [Glycine soja]|nr:hypothetical protein JHK87_055238 [Glycine soja]
MEVDNTDDHPTGPSLEPVACNNAAPAGSVDNTVENDFQDHHSEKSTGLSRRRPRSFQAHSMVPGKVDIQSCLTLTSTGPSRKRKFPLDEVLRPASMCNEVLNSEGNEKNS